MKRTITCIAATCLAGMLTIAGCGGGGGGGAAVTKDQAQTSVATTTTGTTSTATTVTLANATATIPAGTTMTDVSGNPVTGSVTANVTYAKNNADLSTKATAAIASQNLDLVSVVDIVLKNDAGTIVKYLDKPMTVTMKVTGAKPGDTLIHYSYNGVSWVPEETVTVKNDGTVDLTVTHFSNHAVMQPKKEKDTESPTVKKVVPTENATAVPLNTKVTATFSEPVTETTIKKSFTVTDVSGKAVEGVVSYDVDTYGATFTPKADLAASTEYTAKISTDVKDVAGNALKVDKIWKFTTGAAKDTTAPTVKSTIPANNSTGVAVNAKLVITFSEPMDPASIKENLINLVPGGVTYDPATNTATFIPEKNLQYNTKYTFTIRNESAKDLAGNKLTQTTVTFTTTPEGTTGTTGGTGGTGTGGI